MKRSAGPGHAWSAGRKPSLRAPFTFWLLGFLLAATFTQGQTSSPTDTQREKPVPQPAPIGAGSTPEVPAPTSTPSNTPLPVPEMIQVPASDETPASSGPKLELALPQYAEPVLPPVTEPPGGTPIGPEIFVKEFYFEGNHVFSSATLAKLVEKYRGRNVSSEELEEARQAISLFYVNHGYINSGAILPDQDLNGGIVIFKIIEGSLTKVQVHGNRWFQSSYLRNEVRLAAGQPLNFNDLKQGLQLLRENPTISQVNAELRPGGVPGESLLDMDVKDSQPFRLGLEFANNRPPSVGSDIAVLHAADLNLTGNNDPLLLDYGIIQSNGAGFDGSGFDLSDLKNIDGSYTAPVTPWHTTLQVRASRTDSSLIEAPFNVLDITSNLVQYGATLRQTIFENPKREFSLAISADDRRITTKLFGLPFSLSPGDINGVEDVFAVRFTQEFIDRSQVHVLSLRSTFSEGLNAFGATIDNKAPDGEFFSWLGQGQYIRRLGSSNDLLVLRGNAQLTDRPLLSLEQFELGGSSNVRGYLENQVFRDNGVFGSVEVRLPVWTDKDHNSIFAFAPFLDVGYAWNNTNALASDGADGLGGNVSSQDVVLPSIGVGVLYTPNKYVNAQLYWGYALNQAQLPSGNNLQNQGITFDVTVNAF